MKKKIYCDSASTTPLDCRVKREMKKAEKFFANPSSIYLRGKVVSDMLLGARHLVARALSAHPDEIVFTSGGTESNNLAIQGLVQRVLDSGCAINSIHIVTSEVEHSSVLKTFSALEKRGARLSKIGVDENGLIRPEDLKRSINQDTVLVSIMYVNNETGTVMPLKNLMSVIEEERQKRIELGNSNPIYFHTDASQAPLALPVGVNSFNVDMLTLDGHKIYGPKGVGMLYVRRGVPLSPILEGGGQERGVRSTTESLPLIIGFATALVLAEKNRKNFTRRMEKVRGIFLEELKKTIPTVLLNGGQKNRVPHIVNVHIQKIDAEFAVLRLDALGVECATKSSCMKGEEASYVIYAMTHDEMRAKQSIRISFLRDMTDGQAIRAAKIIGTVIMEHRMEN